MGASRIHLSFLLVLTWCSSSSALDPLNPCWRIYGLLKFQAEDVAESTKDLVRGTLGMEESPYLFTDSTSVDDRPGGPKIPKAFLYQMRAKYFAGSLMSGKVYNHEDLNQRADFYEWLAKQNLRPAVGNARAWSLDPKYRSRELEYLKLYLPNAAKYLRQQAEDEAAEKNFGVAKARKVFETADRNSPLGNWAKMQLAQVHWTKLSKDEASAVDALRATGFKRQSESMPAVDLSQLEKPLASEIQKALSHTDSESVRENPALNALARDLLDRVGNRPSVEDAKQYLSQVKKFVYPQIAALARPRVLVASPELTEGWIELGTPYSTGLVAGTPRFALRSPDGKVSIAYQKLQDGTLRVEGYRVQDPDGAAQPFAMDIGREGVVRQIETGNCKSCHAPKSGRIDFTGNNVRNVRSLVSEARQNRGETVDSDVLLKDHPMKKLDANSPESRQMRALLESAYSLHP